MKTRKRYLNIPSHAKMQAILSMVFALYPIGSKWYSRSLGHTFTVASYTPVGAVLISPSFGTSIFEITELVSGTFATLEEHATLAAADIISVDGDGYHKGSVIE